MKKLSAQLLSFLVTSLLLSGAVCAATQAGKVVYAFGQVEAVHADGSSRALKRGDLFGPGDTVTTRKGRAQLRFTDGGFAALQPNTEYAVEDYHYEGKADGKERSFLNLVRGSVRLVTGFIGRSNKSNFRLRTSVATIGIRGTAGKVSHCDANCGERGPGTALAGYDGIWDLKSGSYSGPVKPGQATFCDGSSCFDIPGFGQRSDVADAGEDELDETLDENDETVADGSNEPVFQDGVQTDSSGVQCAVGGNCGSNVIVALNQIAARATQFGPFGDAEALDSINVVFNNGVPVAGVTVDSEASSFEPAAIGITTINPAAVRQAFLDFPDPAISAIGLRILDAIPLEKLAALQSHPASVAEADFGQTTDGLLVKGRWQGGYILDVGSNATGTDVFSELRELSGTQSEHFLFGADPGVLPGSGAARYTFTGGTFSTSVTGATIGQGATAGTLLFNFDLGRGSLDMTVRHAGNTFLVGADLMRSGRFFYETSALASRVGGDSYDAYIHGFFAATGPNAPRAAGLSYVLDTPINIIGTAGFGLQQFIPSVGTGPAAPGSYVSFAHHYIDNFGMMELNSNSFDFIVGAGNTANLTNGFVTSFNSTTHPGLCSPACVFNASSTNPTLSSSGSFAPLGVSWARFGPGYSVAHAEVLSPLGSAHVIKVDAPTPLGNIPGSGTGVYSILRGGTIPTIIFANGGSLQAEQTSTLTAAAMTINFADGSIGGSFAGTVPGGNWTLGGSSSPGTFVASNPIHSLNLSGAVMSATVSTGMVDCSSGCSLFGHTHFDLAGVNASALVGSFQGNTSGGPDFTVAGTYALEGTVTP